MSERYECSVCCYASTSERKLEAHVAKEHSDNIDVCLVCGKEIPPGPDYCSKECEEKANLIRKKLG